MLQTQRELRFEGCHNVRDLGGLSTRDGKRTRFGSVVRADSIDYLTSSGWETLHSYGIRTIIDLRNENELKGVDRPPGISTVRIPLDGNDAEYLSTWTKDPRFGTPLYYRSHLERFPELSARVIEAIAHAPEGGVLFHCVFGKDRTGMIAMLLLALAGVGADSIAEDYALSMVGVEPLYVRHKKEHEKKLVEQVLAQEGRTQKQILRDLLDTIDVDGVLVRGGLADSAKEALKKRLL